MAEQPAFSNAHYTSSHRQSPTTAPSRLPQLCHHRWSSPVGTSRAVTAGGRGGIIRILTQHAVACLYRARPLTKPAAGHVPLQQIRIQMKLPQPDGPIIAAGCQQALLSRVPGHAVDILGVCLVLCVYKRALVLLEPEDAQAVVSCTALLSWISPGHCFSVARMHAS